MTGATANTLWARSFVDELARHGVRDVVIAPGSRSTPLVLACANDSRFRTRVHLDERSAAFFALGAARASRMPCAVITTSGTATANVFPAVIEAAASEVPLLILTADRPHHLRDADANQAIDQVHLFGAYPRLFQDVAPPTASGAALRHLRVLAGRAVAAALGPPAGPVHLNFPFEKPLEPIDVAPPSPAEHERVAYEGRPDGAPLVEIRVGRAAPTESEIIALAGSIDTARGVIVIGPNPDAKKVGAAASRLAERTGFPLLADPLSGARYRPACGAHRVGGYDLFLGDDEVAERLAPSVIVRAGSSPTSAALQDWMGRHRAARHIVVDGGSRWKDHAATASHYVQGDIAYTLRALAEVARRTVSDDWADAWRAAEGATARALQASAGALHEGDAVATVVGALPDDAALFASSSMPVRDLDAFAGPRDGPLQVYGNRGVSGIDGIVSTAFGVASRHRGPTVCVLGDIAFFHDQNGLLWSREKDAPVVFVLIDNDGGAIFHMLPVAGTEPHFTEYFATPHGLDFRHVAELHGVGWADVAIDALDGALREAMEEGRTTILRVGSDRASNHARHVEVRRAVAAAAREALRRERSEAIHESGER